jgi:hypothetical protein
MLKKLRIQISAYKHHADFIIESADSSDDVENAIIDKLGKNDIKWEYLGEMNDPKVNRITYEEVINDANTSNRPLQTKEGFGSRMGAGAS